MGAFLTWQALVMFALGVLASAMVKTWLAAARSKVAGG